MRQQNGHGIERPQPYSIIQWRDPFFIASVYIGALFDKELHNTHLVARRV